MNDYYSDITLLKTIATTANSCLKLPGFISFLDCIEYWHVIKTTGSKIFDLKRRETTKKASEETKFWNKYQIMFSPNGNGFSKKSWQGIWWWGGGEQNYN